MPKPEIEFVDPTTTRNWTGVAGVAGLDELVLARDETAGTHTRLLRFAPGTDTSPLGEQVHDFWEEVWLVEGSVRDLRLERTFTAGMYACRPPGMRHGPWVSERGALLFEVRYGAPTER